MVVAVSNHDHQTSRGNMSSVPRHVTAAHGSPPGAGNDRNEIDDETDDEEEDSEEEEANDTSADETVCVCYYPVPVVADACDRVITGVCYFVCLCMCVYLCSTRKTA